MSDLAEQLRFAADDMDGPLLPIARMYMQLADRIEAYEVEIRRLAADKKHAAITERHKISEWLRSLDKESGDINRFLPTTLANWIEEGMHNL